MNFKSLVGVKPITKIAYENHVLFIRLRCARRSDVIFTCQKIAPKQSILVVYKLGLSPIEIMSFLEVFDR